MIGASMYLGTGDTSVGLLSFVIPLKVKKNLKWIEENLKKNTIGF